MNIDKQKNEEMLDFNLTRMKDLVEDEYITMPEKLTEPRDILDWLIECTDTTYKDARQCDLPGEVKPLHQYSTTNYIKGDPA
ncbi:hypothetical protein MYY45_002132 [Salmonella enterica]|nr:hypothetical protein [Salmonella enterica]